MQRTSVALEKKIEALTRELSEAREQQAATADVLKAISGSQYDLKAVLDRLVKSAARLCDAHDAVIFMRSGGNLHLSAHHGPIPMNISSRPLSRLWVAGCAVMDCRTIHVHDLSTAQEEFPEGQVLARDLGHKSILAVPLVRQGEAVGVIAIRRAEVRPFSERQIELIRTFADQAVIAIENTRLFEAEQARRRELLQALERQTATSEVLAVISRSTTELQPVLDAIVETAARLCRADHANIFRLVEGECRAAASCRLEQDVVAFLQDHPIVPDRGTVIGRTVLEKRTVHIHDVLADPEYTFVEAQRRMDFRTALGVPLMRGDAIIGGIALQRRRIEPFTEEEIELVTTFADQAVIAIENVRLFREVQLRTEELSRALQQQTATADVLKVISRSAFDLQRVLDTLTESAARLCEADMAAITRQEGEGFYYATSYNFPADWLEYTKAIRLKPGRGSIVGRCLLEGKVVQSSDVLSDPEFIYFEPQKKAGFRTFLGVPLLREGHPIGVLVLARKIVAPFSLGQIELVETFADQAVIAIENVRLFQEVETRSAELAAALQQQTATADVLKVISRSAFDLQTVLHTLVESAVKLCDADQGTVTRQIGGRFYRAEAYGFSPEFLEIVRQVPIEPKKGSVAGRALLEGKAVHIADVEADPDYDFEDAKRLGGFRTLLGVPMLREGVPIGVLSLTRLVVRPFTEKQIELVSTFADQAAIAIENARLFEEVRARTDELSRSLEELRSAQDRLVQTEKLASLGQLTAGIAHEIKNPLNFVNNFAGLSVELLDELSEMLRGLSLEEKLKGELEEVMGFLRGNLQKVVHHGGRADSIVKNMLLHSRQGSGEHRPADINAIVEESLNLAYHGARAERQGFNITLETSLDPSAGEVDLFPQEIMRVLLNLISNGFYATRKRAAGEAAGYEPKLSAGTKNLGDHVEITIRDNGTGIPPEVRERMFNPFFTTKPAGEGTGLGLSLSHDIIVKQHAGTIEVESEPGAYTEFRVVLPRRAAAIATAGGEA